MELQRGRAYLTKKGRDLLAYAQTGAELKFNRASVGNGKIESIEQLLNMQELINKVKDITIIGSKFTGDGSATISLKLDNDKQDMGFDVTEVGIYAVDPRFGEILYSVIYFGENPDYIPPSAQEIAEILIDVKVVVGNAENIIINIDRSMICATQEDLLDLAGKGRTNQTVKQNFDLIMELKMELLKYTTVLDNKTKTENLFKMSFPLSQEESWEGIYDKDNNRLIA